MEYMLACDRDMRCLVKYFPFLFILEAFTVLEIFSCPLAVPLKDETGPPPLNAAPVVAVDT